MTNNYYYCFSRYRDQRQLLEARDNAVKSVEAQLQDLYNHHIQHKIALEAIQDLAALSQQVEQPLDVGKFLVIESYRFVPSARRNVMDTWTANKQFLIVPIDRL